MSRLRPFERGDAEEVAALQASAFPESAWPSLAARAEYFREVLLDSPWTDPELPSWVAEDDGRIAGFFGVVARRMRFGSRTLRVAASCQFMVHPERRRSFVALELMRRFLAGPQDLAVADGANDGTRRLWEAAGGLCASPYTLHWRRLLRPAQTLLERRLPALATLAAPLAAPIDRAAALLFPVPDGGSLVEAPLDAASLLRLHEENIGGYALRPCYDLPALSWQLGQLKAKRRNGPLYGCVLREPDGRAAGWFLYCLGPAVSQVMQIGARPGRMHAVFCRLLHHAARRGAAALEGRLEPHLASAMSGTHCLVQSSGVSVLLHARDPGVLAQFLRADTLFTRLDGEWWMRFLGDAASRTSTSPAGSEARLPAPERKSPAAAR